MTKRLAFILPATAIIAAALTGCGISAGPDYGACLHEEGSWQTVVMPANVMPNGMGMNGQPAFSVMEAGGISMRMQYITECAQWEFPTGRPTAPR